MFFDTKKLDERGVPQRTPVGDEVARINAAIKAFDPVFAKARCIEVYHTPPLLPGTKEAPPESWVRPSGDEVLLGVFQDKEKRYYLLAANRDAFHPHEAVLHFVGKITAIDQMDKSTGKWRPLSVAQGDETKIALEAGGGELLRIHREKTQSITRAEK